MTAEFKQNLAGIFRFRDMAVHPSLELKQTCTRPDLPVGVDWKFAAYCCSNAERCFKATMEMLIFFTTERAMTLRLSQRWNASLRRWKS